MPEGGGEKEAGGRVSRESEEEEEEDAMAHTTRQARILLTVPLRVPPGPLSVDEKNRLDQGRPSTDVPVKPFIRIVGFRFEAPVLRRRPDFVCSPSYPVCHGSVSRDSRG